MPRRVSIDKIIALAALSLLVEGCDDKKAASEKNFTKVLEADFHVHDALCTSNAHPNYVITSLDGDSRRVRFALDEGVGSITPTVVKAAESAGVIKVDGYKPTQNLGLSARYYDVTLIDPKAWTDRGICAGTRTFKVTGWTTPQLGQTEVSYDLEITPSYWIKKEDLQKFINLKHAFKVGMQQTNDGWVIMR